MDSSVASTEHSGHAFLNVARTSRSTAPICRRQAIQRRSSGGRRRGGRSWLEVLRELHLLQETQAVCDSLLDRRLPDYQRGFRTMVDRRDDRLAALVAVALACRSVADISLRRKVAQNVTASEGPISIPRISRGHRC
jgi:hypothetical protein